MKGKEGIALLLITLIGASGCEAAASDRNGDAAERLDAAGTQDVASDGLAELGRNDTGTRGDVTSDRNTAPDQVADTASPDSAASDTRASGPIDITDAQLTSRSANCADYVAEYASSVLDLQRNMAFNGSLVITLDGAVCHFESLSIPNHDFNDASAHFATPVAPVQTDYDVPRNPTAAPSPTALSLRVDNAVFLNGVKLDVLAAACYGVGGEPLGRERIGCMAEGTPWRYDPMANDFGTDAHHAHTQPDGSYHYHGDPRALFQDGDASRPSPVIGFAADGFPIFGPYFDDGDTVRRARSGYTLRAGSRVSQPGEGAFPGGTYDGTFVDDWEWTNAGDLDECNGMTVDGAYGYYVTDTYPWVIGCFRGAPHPSFTKRGPGPR